MESEEVVESEQGQQNEEIDATMGTKMFPSLPIAYVWNTEFSPHSESEILINISAPRVWCKATSIMSNSFSVVMIFFSGRSVNKMERVALVRILIVF
jgi:hypothetical protein